MFPWEKIAAHIEVGTLGRIVDAQVVNNFHHRALPIGFESEYFHSLPPEETA